MSEIADWRQIESAPQDVAILLYAAAYRSKSKIVVGWWKNDRRGGRWVIGNGTWFSPTHWMPLPEAPK